MEGKSDKQIICFGEILWDIFPDSKKPGGAPLNVAVHLKRFGYNPLMISKIGDDSLGKDLLEFMESNGINSSFIQSDLKYPTGVVNVSVADNGDASYDIVFPSAWDFVNYPNDLSKEGYILIFGSLASRNNHSKSSLFQLLDNADIALFDVNFRTPHFSRELIEELLIKSDIVKLNEDEIEIIGEWMGVDGLGITDICKKLTELFRIDQVIVTLGSKGAMIYTNEMTFHHSGFKVEVADTVGSGDSFLASYLAHLLKGLPIEECLAIACATGAFVATKSGAVPDYDISEIKEMTNI